MASKSIGTVGLIIPVSESMVKLSLNSPKSAYSISLFLVPAHRFIIIRIKSACMITI